jgi:transposase
MWMMDESHVRRVIHKFNERGMASLDPEYRGGRPRRITSEQRRQDVAVAVRAFAAANRIELVRTPTWDAFAWALARHIQHRNGRQRAKHIRILEAPHQIAA